MDQIKAHKDYNGKIMLAKGKKEDTLLKHTVVIWTNNSNDN